MGKSDGTFKSRSPFAATPLFGPRGGAGVAIADLNGDGELDLVFTQYGFNDCGIISPGHVFVLLGKGDGSYGKETLYSAGNDPESITVVDVNNDGIPDLVVAAPGYNYTQCVGLTYIPPPVGEIHVLLGVGDGTFQPAVTYATAAPSLAVAALDFNHNGRPDLAVLIPGSPDSKITVIPNTCTAAPPILPTPRFQITRTGSLASASWPQATGFRMESSTNLARANWPRVPEPIVTNGSSLQITIPLSAPERFFRLHKP